MQQDAHLRQIHYISFLVASLQQVRNINDKSATSWRLPRLRESYGETCPKDRTKVTEHKDDWMELVNSAPKIEVYTK